MTKTKLVVIGVVAVVALGVVVGLQQQALSRAGEENHVLRDQARHLREELDQVKRSAAVASGDAGNNVREHTELLRLRAEVTRLRRSGREAAEAKAPERPTRPVRNTRPAGAFMPAASWADVGAATPEAAFETLHWALRTGNRERFSQALLVAVAGDAGAGTDASRGSIAMAVAYL